ncbi:hypothetical protein EXIGLDRAFT_744347 [Exidia glandulosa HHB12029]|uniref:Uncharacterized protein n=1 Tax=Exidia glandulosa HHB12029 TaxID=1314781 RepID=A0A166BNX0_EXIGL|nr:hypothetical protein EXIGLDRAFT_744347 [Exidia glandulosa HHB12029]
MQHSTPVRQQSANTSLDGAVDDDASLSFGLDAPIVGEGKTAYFTPEQPQRVSRLFDLPPMVQEDGLTQDQIISALRTMIAAQQEIAIQFDIDLEARDEAVDILTAQLARAKEDRNAWRDEAERRAASHKRLKGKVGELEQLCRSLEEDVEKSREESFERSIMDAASGSALQHLHQTLHELESARSALDGQVRDAEIRLEREIERVQALTRDNDDLRENEDHLRKDLARSRDAEVQLDTRVRELEAELERRTETETSFREETSQLEELRSQVLAAREREADGQTGFESLMTRIRDLQQASEDVKQHWRERQAAWEEERLLIQQDAKDRIGKLNAEIDSLRKKNDALQTDVESKDGELANLTEELEAQWKHAEEATERITALRRDNRDYQEMIQDLEEQRIHLEEDKSRLEERLREQDAQLHEFMEGRSEIGREAEVERQKAEELADLLEQRQAELEQAQQERQKALDDLAQTHDALTERETDLEDRTYHINALEDETDALRERLAEMKAAYERTAEAHSRAMADGERARQQLVDIEKRKAEDDLTADALRTSEETLKDQIASLKRQVHDLQHKNSDQTIEVTQLERKLEEMTATAENLNIALEAKQQELELMKRQQGTRGTAGMTPAHNTVARSNSRTSINRMSGVFTPAPARPPSSSSIASSSAIKPALNERRPSIASSAGMRRTASDTASTSSLRKASIGSAKEATDTFKKPLSVSRASNVASTASTAAGKHSRLSSAESAPSLHSARSSVSSIRASVSSAAALRSSRVPTLSPPSTSRIGMSSPPSSSKITSPTTVRRVSNPNASRLSTTSRVSNTSLSKTPTPADKENKRPQAVPA